MDKTLYAIESKSMDIKIVERVLPNANVIKPIPTVYFIVIVEDYLKFGLIAVNRNEYWLPTYDAAIQLAHVLQKVIDIQ